MSEMIDNKIIVRQFTEQVVNQGNIVEHWGEANTQTCLFEWGAKMAGNETIH